MDTIVEVGEPGGWQYLSAPVSRVRGVGPRRAALLAGAGIETVEDLLLYLPFRYEDRSRLIRVAEARPGEDCAVKAEVRRCRRVGRGGRGRAEATVSDPSGDLRVVWFGQPYVADDIGTGDVVLLFGRVGEHKGKLQLANPVYEKFDSSAGRHVGRLVPIYRRVGDLSPGVLRRLIAAALEDLGEVEEVLPPASLETLGLIGRGTALRGVHEPGEDDALQELNSFRSAAHRRLICEEFLGFQVAARLQRREAGTRRADSADLGHDVLERVLDVLPFALTRGQRAAVDQILADLKAPQPMHRLLQGDVGCGKTAVAGSVALMIALSGQQVALMAPTEILARQHASSLGAWAEALGVGIGCLTGSTAPAERAAMLRKIESGDTSLVVGTHALLEPSVQFRCLRLAIIDEQHRFGVRQRAALRRKGPEGQAAPDLLVMTATPIPRTLALTVYGDLDVHAIEDAPPGRQPVTSTVVPASQWSRVVRMLREVVNRGEQAYVVAPHIEAGEGDLAAAVRLQADLSRQLPDARVGLLHGAQPRDERSAVMGAFANGEVDVLAATTVIEVGVDVPNATLMVVGHAGSFGLAQLHQLRGRVGRGASPSRCVFVAHEPVTPMASQRLEAIRSTRDGFVIAEKDLELRGPGEVLGTRQAGIVGLRVGDPFRDHDWLEATRVEAVRLAQADDDEGAAFRRRVRALWWRPGGGMGAG